jgi:hypothetical protein
MSGRSITPALAFVAVLAGFAVSGASKAGVSTRPTSAREYPLTVVAFATEPNRPKAGRLFTGIMGILDEETGEPLDSGDVYCRGRIGSRRVPLVRAQFVEGSGVAGCIWKIPPQTGGKRFFGRIRVESYEGQVTKKFSRMVRP